VSIRPKFCAALLSLIAVPVLAAAGSSIVPRAQVVFKDAGVPGVSTAEVEGSMASGASHFYLRYAAGLVTPLHHHSADHYVTTVAGDLVLVVDGKETRLPPGSFFALTGKKPHIGRCEGKEDCVMLIDARGPWDVAPEPANM
jgi:quercetin dioxygenase-like cupin family protein